MEIFCNINMVLFIFIKKIGPELHEFRSGEIRHSFLLSGLGAQRVSINF